MSEIKKYERPEMILINYQTNDVLKTSGGGTVYPPDSDWTGFY